MSDDEKHDEDPEPELLPPRDVMSLLDPTSPSGFGGLLGIDPTAITGTTAPTPDATHTAGDASQFAAGHIPPADGQPTASDQPQTVPVDSTKTADSTT